MRIFMGRFTQKIHDLRSSQELLARKPYGMIVAEQGAFDSLQIRPFPKISSLAEAAWIGGFSHRRIRRDRVQVFYNQPIQHPNFLVAKYAVSELGTTLATLRAAFKAFNEIARIKQVDAILCHAINPRITDRFMKYWGFERHHPKGKGRHYIRRFYGSFPSYTDWAASPTHNSLSETLVDP